MTLLLTDHRAGRRALAWAAVVLLALTSLVVGAPTASAAVPSELSRPFEVDEAGYRCFRIPAVVTTQDGTVLAFAEARVADCGDVGDIDLVMKRSFDGGRNWGPIQVLRGRGDTGGFGNPVPVVDSASGRISVLFAYNTWTLDAEGNRRRGPRSLHALHSDRASDGEEWTAGRFLGDLKPSDWTWISVGPGHGIQLTRQSSLAEGASPRIIVPGDHATTSGLAGAQLYYSDDGGQSWYLGARYDVPRSGAHPGETTVVERVDGSIHVNSRSSANCGTADHRLAATSTDHGESFTAEGFTPVRHLPVPPVSASLLRLRATDEGDAGNRVLLSAPVRPGAEATDRQVLAIRSSYDEGASWDPVGTVVHAGRAGYSDLTELRSGEIGVLYETGTHTSHGNIVFTAFTEAAMDAARTDLAFPRTSDTSGNGNHAVVHGGAVLGTGRSGQAMTFDGTDDHLRLINCPASLRFGEGDFTVTAWIRYGATSGAHPIMWGYGQDAGVPQFWLRAEPAGGRLRAWVDTGTASAAVSTAGAYNDNAWHHVVLRRQGGTLSLSVDGGAPATAAAPTGSLVPGGAFTIHIGARPDLEQLFRGAMDEVRVYGRSLTDAEVAAVAAGATDVPDARVRLAFTTIW
ncbi:sialidase family protein [Allostreptomyces psammosilenae]|uniref:exo-alpha-sialidase n=1 Tax=Allostreptomyces psammosilenae TaxID=1892865 RepID=A0A852ZYR1_9ACTN|nr:sialidase family protein [Allostreptomyces psammosilenae]NYI06957.1 sialidase-1 [Allostreptomyces psammosilenae]